MPNIITMYEPVFCEICKFTMTRIQAGRYKCKNCGAKDDMS